MPLVTRTTQFICRWWPAILLGILTIGAYGFSYYSFGVFLEPISTDTGWSKAGLSAAFALGTLAGGVGSIGAGRVFDAHGPKPVFFVGLVAGSGLIMLASSASSLAVFSIMWGLGAGMISSTLFYNVTMATVSRLYPDRRAQAFTVLTFVGGLALPVFGPLSGFIVDEWGWRDAMRILTTIQAAFVLPAIVFVPRLEPAAMTQGTTTTDREGYGRLIDAMYSREVIQMILMFAFSIAAFAAIQVHHVAAFRSAGLSLGTAATLAGVRGLLSLPGRGALAFVQGRLGTPGATLVIYIAMTGGTLLLVPAGHISLVWAFVIVTGLAFGTLVPLQGLYAAEVFGQKRLGTLLGAQALLLALAAAVGPLVVGFAADASGSYKPALVLIASLHTVAILLLITRPRRHPDIKP